MILSYLWMLTLCISYNNICPLFSFDLPVIGKVMPLGQPQACFPATTPSTVPWKYCFLLKTEFSPLKCICTTWIPGVSIAEFFSSVPWQQSYINLDATFELLGKDLSGPLTPNSDSVSLALLYGGISRNMTVSFFEYDPSAAVEGKSVWTVSCFLN